MIRLIIISWICIFLGIGLSLPLSLGLPDSSVVSFALGNTLLMLPNVLWLVVSNKLASSALNRRPSLFVNLSAIFIVFSVFSTFASIANLEFVTHKYSSIGNSRTPIEGIVTFLFPAMFVALIGSIIVVSRRVVDTQESPNVGRGSRIFVLCIYYFYIVIGMFFIAPKLKELKTAH